STIPPSHRLAGAELDGPAVAMGPHGARQAPQAGGEHPVGVPVTNRRCAGRGGAKLSPCIVRTIFLNLVAGRRLCDGAASIRGLPKVGLPERPVWASRLSRSRKEPDARDPAPPRGGRGDKRLPTKVTTIQRRPLR